MSPVSSLYEFMDDINGLVLGSLGKDKDDNSIRKTVEKRITSFNMYKQAVQSEIQNNAKADAKASLAQRQKEAYYEIEEAKLKAVRALAKKLKDGVDDKGDLTLAVDLAQAILKEMRLELGEATERPGRGDDVASLKSRLSDKGIT